MRISHSSSLFLATLAMSSSSSSLAAPTEPGSFDTTALSSSSSIRSLAMTARSEMIGVDVGGNRESYGSVPGVAAHMSHERRGLDLLALLSSLPAVGPILGPLVEKIFAALGLQGGGASAESLDSLSAGGITPNQMHMIGQLLGVAATAIHSAAAAGSSPGAISGVAGAVNSAGSKRNVETSSTSAAASFTSQFPTSTSATFTGSATSVEAMGVPTPPTVPVPVGNSTTPASPPLPVNPPNSPAAAPKPLVPAGASPPSAPIPRDAPPMFPDLKAADASSSSAASASSTSVSPTSASDDAHRTPTMTASQSSMSTSGSASASTSSSA